MDDKTIQREREKLYREVERMIELGVKSEKEISDNSAIIAKRIEDFDVDENIIWRMEENRSYNHGESCAKCKKPVVTSVGMEKMIIRARIEKKKFKIFCLQCGVTAVKNQVKKNESKKLHN